MHINARSSSRNLDALVSELSLLSNMPSVTAVTETWAQTDNDSFPIPGYTSIIKARKNRPGGDEVGLYILLTSAINYEQTFPWIQQVNPCLFNLLIINTKITYFMQ